MPYLRVLGHLDNIWPLAVSLYRERGTLKPVEGLPGVHRAIIIDGAYERAGLEKWTTLRNTIAQARRIAGVEYEMTGATIEQLNGGACIPWETGPDDFAVHIGIIPHPLAMLYSGNEGLSVQFGQVVALSRKFRSSATHEGKSARVHLILNLRQRTIEEES